MRLPDDTITALSTPVGQGGIGIVRMSGPDSMRIVDEVFRPRQGGSLSHMPSHTLIYGHVVEPTDGGIVDEVLATAMRAPRSYTREDVVEIHCHGGMVPVRRVLEVILSMGARLADPGEFTKRAFLNGRISLIQAEAVLDVISAKTEEGMKIAVEQVRGGLSDLLHGIRGALVEVLALAEAHIDFPEDDLGTADTGELISRLSGISCEIAGLSATFREARFFREGLAVAIVGKPNVGKSSLLNVLLRKNRAIVSELPGTTRDVIEEYLNLDGLPVRIMDTAGIRESDEVVEREGIRRSLEALDGADFVIALIDGSQSLDGEDNELLRQIEGRKSIVALSKADLPVRVSPSSPDLGGSRCIRISSLTGEGIEELKSVILESNISAHRENRDGVIVTNIRHKLALDTAGASIERATALLRKGNPLELFAVEMRDALDRIGEITGAVTTEDILDTIFSRFCIGK